MTQNLNYSDEERTAIGKVLNFEGIGGKDIIDKCLAIFKAHPQSINDFTGQIEAFLMNKNQTTLTLATIGQFEQVIVKEHQKSNVKVAQSTPDSVLGKRQAVAVSGNRNMYVTPTFTAPKDINRMTIQPSPISLSQTETKSLEASFTQVQGVKYAQRASKGQNVLTLNPTLSTRGPFEPSQSGSLGMRCKVTTSEDDFLNVNQRFRYMFTPLDERARNLDKHLLSLQKDMCEMASIDETTLQQVGVPSQDLVWVCGRIVCESAEGRINRQSVMLEGSRKESAGRRVHLDLSDMTNIPFSLFPGQIVLVEGINSSGRKMTARRIVEGVAKPMLNSKPSLLLEYHHSKHYQGGQALSVVTAAGPFTTSDNLDYQPLQDLLVHVLETKPDVLILVGPFVDISQPLLSNGHVVLTNDEEDGGDGGSAVRTHLASYEMVFVEKVVRDCLGQMFNSEDDFGGHLPTNIVLVPSLLDGHHEFVFPQPPFGDRDKVDTEFFKEPLGVLDIPYSREADPRRRVHLMPNPCMFRVNEVLFGVSSNDVLFSLSSDEVSQNIDGNRLVRLGSHLLQQQSFSPQFPVQTNTLSQFDLRQSRHWEFKMNPDVLILPSRLGALAKDVHGSILVNPGQLTKGIGGGSYAQMTIHPVKESELRDAVLQGKQTVDHNIFARTNLSIVKI